jgi:hypothetical protein
MIIIYIGRNVIEARTKRLIRKRDRALVNKDYEKVWILNTKIDKNVNRLFSWSCYEIRV